MGRTRTGKNGISRVAPTQMPLATLSMQRPIETSRVSVKDRLLFESELPLEGGQRVITGLSDPGDWMADGREFKDFW